MKAKYTDTFLSDLATMLKREDKLSRKVTKSEKAGHKVKGLSKHPNWKNRWKEFCKYDMDWDYVFLYEVIIHKIELMKTYYEENSLIMEEEKNKVIKSMNEVLNLGDKILNYNYQEEADKYYDEICKGKTGHMIYYVKNGEDVVLHREYDKLDSVFLESYINCKKELKIHPERYSDFPEVDIVSFSDISEEERTKWRTMLSDSEKAKKKDIKKFFSSIGKYIETWWD